MQQLLFTHSGSRVEFLLSLPALQAARKHLGQTRIWLAAPDFACQVARLAGCVDTTLALGAHRSTVSHPSLVKALRALTALRQTSFDAVVTLTEDAVEQAGTFLIRARKRLVRRPAAGRTRPHLTDAVAMLIAELGVPPPLPTPQLTLPPDARLAETQKLAKLGWRDDRLTIALHPTVGFAPQVWPSEYFAELGTRLVMEYGVQLLVIETEEEPGLTERLRPEWKRHNLKPVVLRRPGVATLAAALAQASVVVGSNCAPVHLAVAVRTPSVVVMNGDFDSSYLAPRGRRDRLLYALPSRPVTVDEVFGAVCQVMAASRTGALLASDD
ncbi:hypothetical protein J8C06_11230 [Chloracidobacterium validum]|uniref:ADP-heptose:LPS heptosyltransferase n=1 Tax=Chloracidobacterium validum TaxID=2821543 RepID=A0ABX8BD66_9BACT|nr:glycosyltransferase family 9 protein [Chloracidobacterium validum]QUW04367.1 hypothetical protein J8C06_11230 [Chloracidobacterium validum]